MRWYEACQMDNERGLSVLIQRHTLYIINGYAVDFRSRQWLLLGFYEALDLWYGNLGEVVVIAHTIAVFAVFASLK